MAIEVAITLRDPKRADVFNGPGTGVAATVYVPAATDNVASLY